MTAVGSTEQFFVHDDEEPPRRKKNKGARWVLGSVATLVVLALVAAGAYLFSLHRSYSSNVSHFPELSEEEAQEIFPPEEERPEPTEATNVLLLGTDANGGSGDDEDLPRVPGGGRSDTLMLVHIPEDRDSVQVISIPRDLWVEIPGGRGWHKVNAGLALGGENGHWLTAATVEQLLDVRIDHVAAIDMLGFVGLVDALDGVRVNSSYSQSFTTNEGYTFNPGTQYMDSDQALSFVRHRRSFPDGDLQRIRNQQAFIRAVIQQAATPSTLANPVRTNQMVATFAEHLITDPDLTSTRAGTLAWEGRGALDNIIFTTLPNGGSGWSSDGQWIWHQNIEEQQRISQAMREGTLDDYLTEDEEEDNSD
ncbi:LCP family protein [Nesterenkonia ebinurensis]|uniref:LCP family protein n=1 Tax=Nesterenkonia ebinurensis TaxID=2608252 RepID=UPI00123CF6C9|nr:LCP family protein [Nesterenkonia ebinurensis]